jgi:hypothetical protein
MDKAYRPIRIEFPGASKIEAPTDPEIEQSWRELLTIANRFGGSFPFEPVFL